MSTTSTIIIAIVAIIIAIFLLRLITRKMRGQGSSSAVNEQVYVGNLAYRANHHDLRNYFAKYGTVEEARVVKNYRTGRSKGFGFVTFTSAAEANRALDAHGKDLKGRTIVVRIAKARTDG